MTAAQTGAALTAHGVDLVDEHDGGGGLFRLLKQVAHTAGAHADIHFHKVGTGDGQEFHARLTGHGLGQQSLAGARRAHQQHALGDACAQIVVLLRIAQEVHDLLQLLLFLLCAGHVAEGDRVILVIGGGGVGLAEVGHGVLAASGVLAQEHKVDHGHDHDARQQTGPPGGDPAGRRVRLVAVIGDDAAGPLLLDQLAQILPEEGHIGDLASVLAAVGQVERDGVVLHREALHLLLLEQLDHLTVTEFSRVIGMGDILHGEKKHQDQRPIKGEGS